MRGIWYLPALLCLSVLVGCVIYSVNRFYTDDLKVKVPEAEGEWQLVISSGENVEKDKITAWRITGNTVICYDKQNRRSEFEIVFFKIGNTLLADVVGRSPQNNVFWNVSVIPMHMLLKVELSPKKLTLTPLNMEWFYKKDNDIVKDLAFVKYENNEDCRIFTATPDEWVAFLTKNLGNSDIFAEKQKFELLKLEVKN